MFAGQGLDVSAWGQAEIQRRVKTVQGLGLFLEMPYNSFMTLRQIGSCVLGLAHLATSALGELQSSLYKEKGFPGHCGFCLFSVHDSFMDASHLNIQTGCALPSLLNRRSPAC